MRHDETLWEYTNRYFENRNTLAGVKDEDVIAYYKKGVTNIKIFEKIHEADAHTITDLMAYIDKLVDTQDTVMHDFNKEDHNDGENRSRKRFGEAYVVDPPRPSTFLEGDFNMVMDDQCQFHRDAKHTMMECEQLKHALGVPLNPRRPRATTTTTRTTTAVTTTVTVDLINVITTIVDFTVTTMTGIDVTIAATTATMIVAMTNMTTTVVTIATKTIAMIKGMIVVVTSAMPVVMISMMIDVARTPRPQRQQPQGVRSKQLTKRSTSSSAVAKRPKATGSFDRIQGRSGTSTLKLHNLCVGRSSQSLSPGKILGPHT
jgi:hypothetical protein